MVYRGWWGWRCRRPRMETPCAGYPFLEWGTGRGITARHPGGWPRFHYTKKRMPRPCRVFCDKAGNLSSLGWDGAGVETPALSLKRTDSAPARTIRDEVRA